MDIEIRPYQPRDEDAVVTLWRECDLLTPWSDPHRDIARKLEYQPDTLLVGVVENAVVATVMIGYEGHRGWINYLGVAERYRRHGVGRKMIAAAENMLRELGCPKVNLQVENNNLEVIGFYERLGYISDECIGFGKRLDAPAAQLKAE